MEPSASSFTHIDKKGGIRMVDVTDKEPTFRIAVAKGSVFMSPATLNKIRDNTAEKGNVIEAARIAGIMAAKKTSDLIPMCHPLNISYIKIDFFINDKTDSIIIEAKTHVVDKTGVEMEALTAVSVAALTIYDMCKSYDRGMIISDIRLVEKSGGKSGKFERKGEGNFNTG